MTKEEREEAIRCLSVHSSTNGSGLCTDKQHYEAKQIAIKALEQDPCEDAISRQAVCKIIDDIRDCVSVNGYWAFLERLKKLPPVNPTKTGHWIDDGFYAEGHSHKAFHCSGCGYNVLGFKEDLSNYCPNCGAKMESEEV